MSQEILTSEDNSLPTICGLDSKDRRMVSKNRWARGEGKKKTEGRAAEDTKRQVVLQKKKLRSKGKYDEGSLIGRKTKDRRALRESEVKYGEDLFFFFFFLRVELRGTREDRLDREKRGENGKRWSDGCRQGTSSSLPTSPCILPDITLRCHLPPCHTHTHRHTHTHTQREEICEIISVSWHWINIWGWNLSVEKSPAGKYDWMRSRPRWNVICMSSKWALPPMLRRSKGVRLVGWHNSLSDWLKGATMQVNSCSAGCFLCELQDCPLLAALQTSSLINKKTFKKKNKTQSTHPTFKDRQILAGSCCF